MAEAARSHPNMPRSAARTTTSDVVTADPDIDLANQEGTLGKQERSTIQVQPSVRCRRHLK